MIYSWEDAIYAAWVDVNKPGPTAQVSVLAQRPMGACIMANEVYLAYKTNFGPDDGKLAIDRCPVNDCPNSRMELAAAKGPTAIGTYCDAAKNEIVWDLVTKFDANPIGNYKIHRMSADGNNLRVITNVDDSLDLVSTTNASLQPDRIFFQRTGATADARSTLYSVSTITVNGGLIPLATYAGRTTDVISGNATSVVLNISTSSTTRAVRIPLPNGVPTAEVPTWLEGTLFSGVADDSAFYGTAMSPAVPADAIFRCDLAGPCTNPVTLYRGFQSASAFAQDSLSIYWAIRAPVVGSPSGFAIYRAAK